jgi:hypothetical protein
MNKKSLGCVISAGINLCKGEVPVAFRARPAQVGKAISVAAAFGEISQLGSVPPSVGGGGWCATAD